MKTSIFISIILGFVILISSCHSKQSDPFPSIFLVKDKTPGYASIEDLKNIDLDSHQGILWKDFIKQSDNDLKLTYIDPTTDFEGRSPVHLK